MKSISPIILFITMSLFMAFNILGTDIKEGVIRTPDSYFENIKDWSYEPKYKESIKEL